MANSFCLFPNCNIFPFGAHFGPYLFPNCNISPSRAHFGPNLFPNEHLFSSVANLTTILCPIQMKRGYPYWNIPFDYYYILFF